MPQMVVRVRPGATPAAASSSASPGPRSASMYSLARMQKWMPKSTPKPMNSTAKATEIRFNSPTTPTAKHAVHAKPTSSEKVAASTSRIERSPMISRRHDDAERKEIGEADALLDALQLLFHHHRLSGETNPDAVLGREPQLRGRRADQGDGSLRRLQRIEVEQRLEQQILSRAGETRIGVPGERASPREAGGMAGRDLLHRPGDALQRRLELPRQAAVGGARSVDIAQRQRQHLREAAQARVLRQRREQRLSAGHHTAEGLQLLDRQEEQAVPAEKRIRFGMKGVTDHVGTLRQPLRELLRRPFSPVPACRRR